jgi:hypothetical protein
LAKVAVQCLVETFVKGPTFVLRIDPAIKQDGENRHLLQARSLNVLIKI